MATSRHRVRVKVNGQEFLVELGDLNTTPVIAVVEGQTFEVVLREPGGEGALRPGTIESLQEPRAVMPPGVKGRTSVIAPMPGDIVEVYVRPGQEVGVGDPLCVLEAMKMNNIIRSPRKGRISRVGVSSGQSVDHGHELVTFE